MSDLGMVPGAAAFGLKDMVPPAPEPQVTPTVGAQQLFTLHGPDGMPATGRSVAVTRRGDQMVGAAKPIPGLSERAARIMDATDHVGASSAVTNTEDPFIAGKFAGVMASYAASLAHLAPEERDPAAQFDFAKLDDAIEAGKFEGNKEFLATWRKLQAGGDVDPEQLTTFMAQAKTVADATDAIPTASMEFEKARVSHIKLTEEGPALTVTWDEPSPNVEAALASTPTRIPLFDGDEEEGLYVTPDGSAVPFGPKTVQGALRARHLYPAVTLPGGRAVYAQGGPRKVLDTERFLRTLATQMEGHTAEKWSAAAFDGVHPAARGGTTIMVSMPAAMGANVRAKQRKALEQYGRLVDPGEQALIEGPDEEDGRTAARARLVAVEVPADEAKNVKAIAQRLEDNGGTVRTIYTPHKIEGWSRVRDHVYTDGVSTAVVRSADQELDSPHGFTGWVKSAEGLPSSNPHGQRQGTPVSMGRRQDGSYIVNGQVVLWGPLGDLKKPTDIAEVSRDGEQATHLAVDTSTPVPTITLTWGAGDVELAGNRLVIRSEPGDMTDAVRKADVLASTGFPLTWIELKVGDRTVHLS